MSLKGWPADPAIKGELLKCCRRRSMFTSNTSAQLAQSTRYFVLGQELTGPRLCWAKNEKRPTKSLDLKRARLTLLQGGPQRVSTAPQ